MKILHILPQFQPGGGIDSVVMNYFNNIDQNLYSFDILTHKIEDFTYAKLIKQAGGNVYILPQFNLTNIRRIVYEYRKIIQKNNYDVVHCHMANAAFIYLKIAKDAGIQLRILHSHQDHYADKLTHAVRNVPLVFLGKKYSNLNVACSKKAGEFLFRRKKFIVLKNGIDIRKFEYNADNRRLFREKYKLDSNAIVFGIVGRLVPQKNPFFAIDVFSEFCKIVSYNSILVIAGDGELRHSLQQYTKTRLINHNILWLGNIDNVAMLDSGLDVLLMPSKYEGLGLSLIEAQAAGVLCLASDSIPEEAFITDHIFALPISHGSSPWVSCIQEALKLNIDRKRASIDVKKMGFDSKSVGHSLSVIYDSVGKNGN